MLDDSISSFSFQSVWKARQARDGARYYYINPDHPIIKKLLTKDLITNKEFQKAIEVIGDTTPVESIIQYQSEDPESHEMRGNNTELDSGTIELAKLMYQSLLDSGKSKEIAIKQILTSDCLFL